MKLADKILTLRKQNGLSQEELAEKMNISRQAISRWEVGTAQPDASNVLQLSKLFGVTTDYLLNDDYESDHDVPAVKDSEAAAKRKIRKITAICVGACGLFGNFVIYILSRFIKVVVPYTTYENGRKWYHWNGAVKGRSYIYFIQEYDLEFLSILFWGMFLAGVIYIFVNRNRPGEANIRAEK